MGYNTASTDWPSLPPSQSVQALIDRFFNLLDSTSSNVGDMLAEEVFAVDAKAQFGLHAFEGQYHSQEVYSHDESGSDLLFLAYVEMDLKNGMRVEGEFTGRCVIADVQASTPKLKLYSIWADSAPLVLALKAN
ncbi:uncharacterized protein A1O9_12859 [Exophiala aquamarina CBS 119918]|uniref:SnoaL-like domain-containing protein n=1 Tax=Exophiala aquamarina CBS 119918 TaxID=1182545 RepID=A0A072NUK9_9EURO|nr:uncharacterized protein A1O9_12859 [Exophiala aquamarina CBS 119918]KEF51077.1 hypothetical protein A1O9_12859 [Exophiala aquamarina CBS 119918]